MRCTKAHAAAAIAVRAEHTHGLFGNSSVAIWMHENLSAPLANTFALRTLRSDSRVSGSPFRCIFASLVRVGIFKGSKVLELSVRSTVPRHVARLLQKFSADMDGLCIFKESQRRSRSIVIKVDRVAMNHSAC